LNTYGHKPEPTSERQEVPKLTLALNRASYPEIDTEVEKFMKNLQDRRLISRLSGSQLRKIHEQVTKIRRLYIEAQIRNQSDKLEKCKMELVRLKYLLAYQKARLSKKEEEEVFGILSECFRNAVEVIIGNIKNTRVADELIEKLYITSEAMIAYHKYYGGGD